MTILLDGLDIEKKRKEIRTYFHKTFTFFEETFEIFKDDTVFYKQSIETRHPNIFYFGHTASFFINKLILMKIIDERVNPSFESIFSTGVDEMSWDDMNHSNYNWPKVEEVRIYRNQVRELVDKLITTLPLTLPITQESPWWVLLMGIEHENIHIETSSVLHRQMPLSFIKQNDQFKICENVGQHPENKFVKVAAQNIFQGKDKTHHLYGWDNEYGKKDIKVDSFEASKFLVSNGEFLEFVQDNGYENNEFWSAEGQIFLNESKAKYPTFWEQQQNGSFLYRALTKNLPLPLNWPVDVNYLEAKAFCLWKANKIKEYVRLPTEAEWYVLYENSKLDVNNIFDEKKSNINFSKYASSMPINTFKQGDFYDVVGNVWQWS